MLFRWLKLTLSSFRFFKQPVTRKKEKNDYHNNRKKMKNSWTQHCSLMRLLDSEHLAKVCMCWVTQARPWRHHPKGRCDQAALGTQSTALPGDLLGWEGEQFSRQPHLSTGCLLTGGLGSAERHTNFSRKMGDLVFWQIQNSHRLEELDIGRNGFNQGMVYVPFFQVRLLLQGVWELLEQVNDRVALGPQCVRACTKPRNTCAYLKSQSERSWEVMRESVRGDCQLPGVSEKADHCGGHSSRSKRSAQLRTAVNLWYYSSEMPGQHRQAGSQPQPQHALLFTHASLTSKNTACPCTRLFDLACISLAL